MQGFVNSREFAFVAQFRVCEELHARFVGIGDVDSASFSRGLSFVHGVHDVEGCSLRDSLLPH